jgi:hypothetical protein
MSIISYAVNTAKKQEFELGKGCFRGENLVDRTEDELVEILIRVYKSMPESVAHLMAKEIHQMGVEFVAEDTYVDSGWADCEGIGSVWDYDWRTGALLTADNPYVSPQVPITDNKSFTDNSTHQRSLGVTGPNGIPLPDRDYSCGAAFCDDQACNTHGLKDADGDLLYWEDRG